jgi:hypothetical protein
LSPEAAEAWVLPVHTLILAFKPHLPADGGNKLQNIFFMITGLLIKKEKSPVGKCRILRNMIV